MTTVSGDGKDLAGFSLTRNQVLITYDVSCMADMSRHLRASFSANRGYRALGEKKTPTSYSAPIRLVRRPRQSCFQTIASPDDIVPSRPSPPGPLCCSDAGNLGRESIGGPTPGSVGGVWWRRPWDLDGPQMCPWIASPRRPRGCGARTMGAHISEGGPGTGTAPSRVTHRTKSSSSPPGHLRL